MAIITYFEAMRSYCLVGDVMFCLYLSVFFKPIMSSPFAGLSHISSLSDLILRSEIS